MDKKWLIGIALISILGFASALTLFNDTVEVWSSDVRGFVVVENFLSPKDHFRVDTMPGGKVYSTSIEPIGAPNPSLGSSTNKWKLYSSEIHGQIDTINAGRGFTCDSLCDLTLDGTDYPTSNWSCIKATNMDGTLTACNVSALEKNCVCKN